jgi:hypothetical protein
VPVKIELDGGHELSLHPYLPASGEGQPEAGGERTGAAHDQTLALVTPVGGVLGAIEVDAHDGGRHGGGQPGGGGCG